ncbi:hypothetical protein EXIGLDRAFT_784095 [Exidia glandulosa HHB12029]|uniref:Uncharacterized protein n=1 Tax=Exidia glandulosa HHB12029 TaxID=1314781 RepID=A0A166MPJ4_EXIGL|nr:hypothetical protein EXIGLDRAFT_784095 [Exidia glandulosa HHB12029]
MSVLPKFTFTPSNVSVPSTCSSVFDLPHAVPRNVLATFISTGWPLERIEVEMGKILSVADALGNIGRLTSRMDSYGVTCTSTIPGVTHTTSTAAVALGDMPTSSNLFLNVTTDRTKWIFPSRGCSLLLNRHEILYRFLPVEVTARAYCLAGHRGRSCWSAGSFRMLLDRVLLRSAAPTRLPFRHNSTQALSSVLHLATVFSKRPVLGPLASAFARATILLTSGNDRSLGRGQDSSSYIIGEDLAQHSLFLPGTSTHQ